MLACTRWFFEIEITGEVAEYGTVFVFANGSTIDPFTHLAFSSRPGKEAVGL